jgi:hypothetical protein
MYLSRGTDAQQAFCLEVSGVGGARRKFDFTQQQETYTDGGRTTSPPPLPHLKEAVYISSSLLVKSHSLYTPAALQAPRTVLAVSPCP